MGKNDVALSSYFSDPQIFADLFNAWMYGGKQVIDYSAPVRIMQFDSADYQNQVRRTEEENRKRMGLKTGLPAFFREDRIVPVITLILYFGEEEWDRPVRLHDMLTFPEKDDTIRSLVPDYPIHVISVRRDGAKGMDISLLHTELRQVFGFLQHQEDKEGLKRYVEENRAVFSRLSGNAALFLAASAHETRLLKGLNREEEHYDMCRALDEWYADGVSEGEKIGERKGIYKGLSSALLRILDKKGSVPEKYLTYISSLKNMDRLNQLLDLAVASETVAEFEKRAGI